MKQLFVWALFAPLVFSCNTPKPEEKKEEPPVVTEAKPQQPAEFADPKYTELGKSALAALTNGDVDGWVSAYADNAVFMWNNGDSIVGKPAITAYWKKRRTEVIDSISFSNLIFLPLRVNQPQSIEQPGVWLLGWYRVSTKYKSGGKMTQMLHTDMHFNANDQVDRVIQYIDRVPVNAAMKK
ncbi:nuclear transport factor 2 family protein [Flavihumibacter profundi]|jgi:hypothetical protein|uniref:nuclear transport factor 2 family protein n=1 Tax=Flavihumibacter profundi TaxID=2716883 RepID=UPI001CC5BC2D|nr:nuclear transport factor 2 family protein [Flavihumibacter profundi]MBZ5855583.1 nuclear transport factor 2 family protein [Flavihumibacter profundi]